MSEIFALHKTFVGGMNIAFLARSLNLLCYSQNEDDIMQFLWKIPEVMRYGCITAAPKKGEQTTFDVAVMFNLVKVVKLMVRLGGLRVLTDSSLWYAIDEDFPAMIDLLIKYRVNINGNAEHNPLRLAVRKRQHQVVKKLLALGAKPDLALEEAILVKEPIYLMLLLAYDCPLDRLHKTYAVHLVTYIQMKLLLAFGAERAMRSHTWYYCSKYGDPCVVLLISADVHVPKRYYDQFNRPSLFQTTKTQLRFARIRQQVRKLRV